MVFKKIKEFLHMDSMTSLSKKTVKSSTLIFGARAIDQIFRIIRTVVLARLLSPNDFGLFAIALIMLSILDAFSQTGFGHALIQKDGEIESYLDTAWWIQFGRGLILALILFFSAPLVAIFFNVKEAEFILKVIALGIFIQGLNNVAVIYFEKNLEFHKYLLYQFTGTITDFVFAITSAIIFRSVWALIIGFIAGNIARLIVSYCINPHWPKFVFDISKMKSMSVFGKWVSFSSVMGFFILQGDNLLVGKVLGVDALGFYQMAYRIANIPSTEVVNALSPVIFPAYAKIQNNIIKLKENYLKTFQLLSFIFFPAAAGIFILAKEATFLFLGQKWLPIVPIMQVSVIAGLLRAIAATTGPVFFAVGKPSIDTKIQTLRFLIMMLLIYPFIYMWGVLGAAWAVLLSILISVVIFSYMTVKIIKCKPGEFLKLIFIPFLNSAAMVLVVFFIKIFLPINIVSFLLLVFIGMATYFMFVYLSDRFLGYKVKSIMLEILTLVLK